MKAIRAHAFGGPDQLQLDDVADPTPAAGEVLVRIHAAGVNPADTYMLGGTYAMVPPLPYIPGGDAAGVVEATGSGVTTFKPGDRVLVSASLSKSLTGCYAELVCRPEGDLTAIPDAMDFAQAAAIGVPYVTAHFALFSRGRAQQGETVFIHGASGAVGTAAIQLAKRAGLKVIGSAGSDKGLGLVLDQGADLVVDHSAPDYLDQVRAAVQNGPELILEMLANENLGTDLDLVARFGRIVVIGCRGDATIAPRLAMMKEVDVLGTAIWNASRQQVITSLNDILLGIEAGQISPQIGATFPLDQVPEAHRAILNNKATGKIILALR